MKKIRVAINGFGRIGRITYRKLIENPNMEVVAVNDLADTKTIAHLLKYDSVHGRFPGEVINNGDHILVGGRKVLVFAQDNPGRLPWKNLDIDIVHRWLRPIVLKNICTFPKNSGTISINIPKYGNAEKIFLFLSPGSIVRTDRRC